MSKFFLSALAIPILAALAGFLPLASIAYAQTYDSRPLGRAAPPPDDEVTVTGKSRLWKEYETHKMELERLRKAFPNPDAYVSARDQFLAGQDYKDRAGWENRSHLLDVSKSGLLDAPVREAIKGRSSQD